MYYGERRNVAFSIETKPGEKTGTIHWLGSDPIPLRFESPLGVMNFRVVGFTRRRGHAYCPSNGG